MLEQIRNTFGNTRSYLTEDICAIVRVYYTDVTAIKDDLKAWESS